MDLFFSNGGYLLMAYIFLPTCHHHFRLLKNTWNICIFSVETKIELVFFWVGQSQVSYSSCIMGMFVVAYYNLGRVF